jgi:hypothetical protein
MGRWLHLRPSGLAAYDGRARRALYRLPAEETE